MSVDSLARFDKANAADWTTDLLGLCGRKIFIFKHTFNKKKILWNLPVIFINHKDINSYMYLFSKKNNDLPARVAPEGGWFPEPGAVVYILHCLLPNSPESRHSDPTDGINVHEIKLMPKKVLTQYLPFLQ